MLDDECMEAIHNLLYEDSLELLPNPTFDQNSNQDPVHRAPKPTGFWKNICSAILDLLRTLTGR